VAITTNELINRQGEVNIEDCSFPLPTPQDYEKLSDDELRSRIIEAKEQKGAVLLVHNYQRLEIQDLADYMGDSLGLSIEATRCDSSLIVFCGVDFMAESAKILNPEKKVILPHRKANCPMALMVDLDGLREMKKRHPDAVVVSYVNSTAEIKAETDICCTSSNAVQVVKSLGDRKIIFVPDKNLANYTKSVTGANIIPWEGYCYVHNGFTAEDVQRARKEYPGAILIAHPECQMSVLEHADYITSTSGMVQWVDNNLGLVDEKGVIIGTEIGLVKQIQKKHPGRNIYPLAWKAVCRTMKLTDLPHLCWAIENEQHEIVVPEEVRIKAYSALKRMTDILPD
jgi:quinolinate synthase